MENEEWIKHGACWKQNVLLAVMKQNEIYKHQESIEFIPLENVWFLYYFFINGKNNMVTNSFHLKKLII